MRICAVSVFYNPDKDVIKNIESYLNLVEKLYIIDNSKSDNYYLLDNSVLNLKKIEYIPLKNNMGLGYALNVGCRKGLEEEFNYILTMDQDSCFEKEALNKMITFLKNNKNYSIVSPNVRSLYIDEQSNIEKEAFIQYPVNVNSERNWTMTSGSLMNLSDYDAVKGFDELLFIAHLDIDLGIKFHQLGKKIIVIGDAILNQHFGNSKPKRILWKTVHPSYASPVRTYYIFRNQKYLEMKYGNSIKNYIAVSLYKFVIKITLFEDCKFEKYKMMIRGLKDGKRGDMGPYIEKRE